jgi:hypothetical protein
MMELQHHDDNNNNGKPRRQQHHPMIHKTNRISRSNADTAKYKRFQMILMNMVVTFYSCLCIENLGMVVEGFASNLIVTTMGCMTDLSTEEVIMNNEVKSPEDSDFPKMHLVVLDASNNHIESPFHYDTSTEQLPEISIAFVNPYSTDEFSEDIQFVMEVDGPASFIEGGTIGCDGNKRVAARLTDDEGKVVLKVNDPTATLRVWGGWATGHNPVRLTPDLILQPAPNAVAGSGTSPQKEEVKQATTRDVQKTTTEEEIKSINEEIKQEVVEPEKDRELDEDVAAVKAQAAKPRKKNLLESEDVHPELKEIPDHRDHHNTKQKVIHHNKERGQTATTVGGARNIAEKITQNKLDLAAERRTGRQVMNHKVEESTDDDYDTETGGEEDGTNNEQQRRTAKELGEKIKAARELDMKRRESDERMKKHRAKLEEDMRKNFGTQSNSSDLNIVSHLLGCAFFVVCIGGFLIFFGKKRDKGRRDL